MSHAAGPATAPHTAGTAEVNPWRARADAVDWATVRADLDRYGCGLTGPLLTCAEAAEIAALYTDVSRFRSTVNMARHRFGEGEYRYFAAPFPEAVAELREALYPRLLPVARDWWDRLGRTAPWPDSLREWLRMCHAAGQRRPTPILLKYGEGDWNALHRDIYGELVFPLQRVGNPLGAPGHPRPCLPRRRMIGERRGKKYTLIGRDGKPHKSAVPGAWGGHRGSKIYGRLDCPSALRAIARGGYARCRVFFADEETAVAAGYRPCATCCNDRYRAWKAR